MPWALCPLASWAKKLFLSAFSPAAALGTMPSFPIVAFKSSIAVLLCEWIEFSMPNVQDKGDNGKKDTTERQKQRNTKRKDVRQVR
mmetsp:Transcript_107655/g.169981  ORF Transcript_107655/g.169981 Transcript_107655/m.169981 type:complete len:86 (+) Transcript_107655:84-341(+)